MTDFNSPTPGSGQQQIKSSFRGEPRSRSANDASLVNSKNHEPASDLIQFEHALDELLRAYAAYIKEPLGNSGDFLESRASVVRLFEGAA